MIVDEIHARRARQARRAPRALARAARGALRAPAAAHRPLGDAAPDRARSRGSSSARGRARRRGGAPRCAIVDVGHRRAPRPRDRGARRASSARSPRTSSGPRSTTASRSSSREHRTTLVFVNTRRWPSALAHQLAERLGEERVAAHHGSLSRTRRLPRRGAAARAASCAPSSRPRRSSSGIDIGPVDLVCQIGSPRALATLPAARRPLGPRARRDAEGPALPDDARRAGRVRGARARRARRAARRASHPPARAARHPRAADRRRVRGASRGTRTSSSRWCGAPRRTRSSRASDFDAVVAMLVRGHRDRPRPRARAHLHRDRVNGVLRGRRGARLAALTSGGAIPETRRLPRGRRSRRHVRRHGRRGLRDREHGRRRLPARQHVVAHPARRAGRRARRGRAGRAADACRSGSARRRRARAELSRRGVGACARRSSARLERAARRTARRAGSTRECGARARGARAARALPRRRARARSASSRRSDDVVFERFFDEAGGMQLVVHAPFGGRINRALGLALRKRFCRSFDFELQAAASDDAIVLSLGPQHSFPLETFALPARARRAARDARAGACSRRRCSRARWRWNATRALAVLRQRGGRRVPPPIQRMRADDLLAAVFPAQARVPGERRPAPIELARPPARAPDAARLPARGDGRRRASSALLAAHRARRGARSHLRDSTEPSPLAHEILNAQPVHVPRRRAARGAPHARGGAAPRAARASQRDLGALDAEAIARVRERGAPGRRATPTSCTTLLLDARGACGARAPRGGRGSPRWSRPAAPRASTAPAGALLGRGRARARWSRRSFPDARFAPDARAACRRSRREAARAPRTPRLRGAARPPRACSGPSTAADARGARSASRAALVERRARARSRREGFVLRGRFTPARAEPTRSSATGGCSRASTAYTLDRLRREIEPVTAQDFMRFLLRWQHARAGHAARGRARRCSP